MDLCQAILPLSLPTPDFVIKIHRQIAMVTAAVVDQAAALLGEGAVVVVEVVDGERLLACGTCYDFVHRGRQKVEQFNLLSFHRCLGLCKFALPIQDNNQACEVEC